MLSNSVVLDSGTPESSCATLPQLPTLAIDEMKMIGVLYCDSSAKLMARAVPAICVFSYDSSERLKSTDQAEWINVVAVERRCLYVASLRPK